MDKIAPKLGSKVLLFGAGLTGLVLAQMLRLNGASQLVIAAPGRPKMDLERSLNASDEYVELPRDKEAAKAMRENIKSKNQYGFDIVVEATGSVEVVEDSINFVRKGEKLVVQVYKFPATISYLDTGKVKVTGIVNSAFRVEQWQECLHAMKNKTVIKAALVFD
ncbi:hypothetical protein ZTR_00572 [Talaromyces verruculosus]|nr:hypothetical protein ZTR_00572 [Talaromyces verruculosus]